MKIMITGPQGCGKTTQARLLADKLSVPFVGAGDLLRERATRDDDTGKSIREDLAKGRLVDDDLLAELVRKEISSPGYQNGFVADGYPRTLSQFENFDPGYDKVFYLEISDDEVEQRLLKRGRTDDTPELIKERLSWYHEQTRPLLDHYSNDGKLVVIDGDQPISQVAQQIGDEVKKGQ